MKLIPFGCTKLVAQLHPEATTLIEIQAELTVLSWSLHCSWKYWMLGQLLLAVSTEIAPLLDTETPRVPALSSTVEQSFPPAVFRLITHS